ncbi:MAG: 3-dehydroquinate synthase [Verrucomicrobia bacterium]|nr:3-dehydroquinate synthase [Verrucomicrobiota bacterium]
MITRTIQLTYEHRVIFTRSIFDPANPVLRDLIATARGTGRHPVKTLLVVDQGLATADPLLEERIARYAEAHREVIGFTGAPLLLPGGEACKNDWSLVERIWQRIHADGICRHSFVIAAGGGALLDLTGFAATTAHRGIRHIRLPTTTLSQGDGGVGVKNGVNYFGKKNWVGTFAIPHAVVNDLDFLRLLPPPQRRAGIIEAIKVSLIRDRSLFETMEAMSGSLAQLEEQALETVIRRSAELHMNHIALGGDPFELGSARPLDFGHWSAHKLEQISGFRLGHGEAVAIGMAVDLIYAHRLGLLSAEDEQRALSLIRAVGFDLHAPELTIRQNGELVIVRGLEEFREHLGGELTITLVTGIGRAVEVHEMDTTVLSQVLDELTVRFGSAQAGPVSASRVA